MKIMRLTALLLACSASLLQAAPSADDLAKFVAGLPVRDSALAAMERDNNWIGHAAVLDKKWVKMDQRQLVPVRAWAAGNPAVSRVSGTVFYTFSGPDFLYAHSLFPNASTYILCGTEPVGSVPDITQMQPQHVAGDLANVRTALDTMLTTHYFITKDMRVDLTRGNISGTLPILYFFLARTGCTIQGVKLTGTSVQIDFRGPSGKSQTVYYIKTDLSNGGSNAQFFAFCNKHAPGASLVKSASYLLHGDSFSKVRNWILANSSVIIQDDSGIPFHSFDPKRWTIRLYGSYEGPIGLFKEHYQPALATAYQQSNPAPLGFAFGYAWQKEKGMLIQATPK
ncbi:MAG TPA: hypothetical protein VK961_22195 [Chthoniobacter sp.]|nr:hypothetical protein [Chthoniobacter sp.]